MGADGGLGRKLVFLPPVLVAGALVAAWTLFDLGSLDAANLERTLEQVRGQPLAPFFVVAGFAVSAVLFVPITALILATAVTFGPWLGFAYSLAGICAGACSTYWVGRWIGAPAMTRITGPRFERLADALRKRAFRASALARMAPVGNFTIMNMFAGSIRIHFPAFFLGSLVGAAPGTLLLTQFGERVFRLLRAPSPTEFAVLAVVVLCGVGLALWLRRVWR
jgi:phospholipase D1/2